MTILYRWEDEYSNEIGKFYESFGKCWYDTWEHIRCNSSKLPIGTEIEIYALLVNEVDGRFTCSLSLEYSGSCVHQDLGNGHGFWQWVNTKWEEVEV